MGLRTRATAAGSPFPTPGVARQLLDSLGYSSPRPPRTGRAWWLGLQTRLFRRPRAAVLAIATLAGCGLGREKRERPGLGTGFGEQYESHVMEVAFERASSHPAAVLTTRYGATHAPPVPGAARPGPAGLALDRW
jgi:hypothetical protein